MNGNQEEGNQNSIIISILPVAPSGRLKLAMPVVTSPDATAQEMDTGRVAAPLAEANAKVYAGIIFLKYASGFFLLTKIYIPQ